MGDGLLATFKRSNSIFIMLYLYHVMDVNYLVVGEMINIKNCLITLACLVQVATYDVNYLNMAKT
jgi:hypothetical protein